jgi:hypothetical protein
MNELNPKKTLDIGETINDAFEIYKKIALNSGLAYMIMTFALVILGFIGLGYFTNLQELPKLLEKFDPNKLSLKGTLIYFGTILTITALISPFIAGMLKMAQEADNNEEVKFSSIFVYVNSPHFVHIILATVLISLTSISLNVSLSHILPKPFSELVGMVVSASISIVTFITIPLIIFKNLSFIEALKASISNTYSHFFIILLLIIIAVLLAFVGVLAFCFGLFFTVPFFYAMQYSVYKRLG